MLSFTHEKRQFRICVRELGITEKVKKKEGKRREEEVQWKMKFTLKKKKELIKIIQPAEVQICAIDYGQAAS